MKSKILSVFAVIVFILLLPLFLGNSSYKKPNVYYQVYLDGNYIGTILSESELKKYVKAQTETIKENIRVYKLRLEAIDTFNKLSKLSKETDKLEKVKDLINNAKSLKIDDLSLENLNTYYKDELYNLEAKDVINIKDYIEKNDIYLHTNEVYIPNGIDIKKIYTYNDEIYTVKDIYKKIISEKSCTIAGYKFTIKSTSDSIDDIVIYTLDKDIFGDAIDKLISIFISDDEYAAYVKNNQTPIETTGSRIENVYIAQDIAYKAVNVSVDEKIYTDASDLTAFLLYDENHKEKVVKVKAGDTIESMAYANKISIQEFLISNPQYTSKDNLIAQGTDIKVASINPKVQVVEEKYEVFDKSVNYNVIEKYDANANQGNIRIVQEGEKGVERIAQNTKVVNGEIAFVSPVSKTVIKSSVPKIIVIGTKYVPHIGSLSSWGWPTNSGYTITSYYGYRSAIYGLYNSTNWHSGIDIAGTGYGSPIYAANNGVIMNKEWGGSYGNYIQINHNNGYYTLYAHMSGFANVSVGETVTRGQIIGYVGMTGAATGPHLHYEIRTCEYYSCTVNPLLYY